MRANGNAPFRHVSIDHLVNDSIDISTLLFHFPVLFLLFLLFPLLLLLPFFPVFLLLLLPLLHSFLHHPTINITTKSHSNICSSLNRIRPTSTGVHPPLPLGLPPQGEIQSPIQAQGDFSPQRSGAWGSLG
ncbi:unnamed protein product [Closterium sp. NIES-53]